MHSEDEIQTGWVARPETKQTLSRNRNETAPAPSPSSAAPVDEENPLDDHVPAWIDCCIERISTIIDSMHRHAASSRVSDSLFARIFKRVVSHDSSSTRLTDQSLLSMVSSRLENIDLLLEAFDDLADYIREVYKTEGLDAASAIVNKLANVPHLVPTIVFLRDQESRDEIFAHPCIRRVIFCTNTTLSEKSQVQQRDAASVASGLKDSFHISWILEALESKGVSGPQKTTIHDAVVKYLVRVSSLTIIDYAAVLVDKAKLENYELGIHPPAPEVVASFEKDCQNLFDFISGFKMLVPLLFSLPRELKEEAALTSVVENAMNELMQRPFMITQVFTDLFWYCVLIYVVRNSIYMDQDNYSATARTSYNSNFLVKCLQPPCYLYFIARTIADVLSFGLISRAYFFQNLISWTILVDVVSVTLFVGNVFVVWFTPLAAKQDNVGYVIFQTCVLGMAWVKTIGFIHFFHPNLAVLVISSFEMIKVILPFLVVLAIFIFGFGDIMHTAYQPECQAHQDDENVFCQSSQLQNYMAIYRLLVGDISYDDFNANRFTSTLFVLVTCMGIIFLLNLLIAVISEAYTDSVSRSQRLYGRKRIVLLTKSLLLEEQLRGERVGCRMRLFVGLSYVAVFAPLISFSIRYYSYWHDDFPKASDVILAFVIACLASVVVFFLLISRIPCFGEMNNVICSCLCTKPLRWVLLTIMGHCGKKKCAGVDFQDDSETRIKAAVRRETLLLRAYIESQHKEIAQLREWFETDRNTTKKQWRDLEVQQNILCKTLVDEIRSLLTENSNDEWVTNPERRHL